jgi:hypothetical protein
LWVVFAIHERTREIVRFCVGIRYSRPGVTKIWTMFDPNARFAAVPE